MSPTPIQMRPRYLSSQVDHNNPDGDTDYKAYHNNPDGETDAMAWENNPYGPRIQP